MLRRDPLALVAWLVLCAWMGLTAAAFWHFELGNWRGFSESQVPPVVNAALAEEWLHSVSGLQSPAAATSGLTLVHLYSPNCRCNRFTEPHLARLQEAFRGRGVRFVVAASGNGPAPLGLEAVHAGARMLHAAGFHSAPAALIFDAGGRLIYYGPYSNSAWCGSSGALVDPVLTRALSGSVQFSGVPAVRGCFCEW
jgi:hypothetical protein